MSREYHSTKAKDDAVQQHHGTQQHLWYLDLDVKKFITESHSYSYQRDANVVWYICHCLDSWVTVVPVSFDKTYEQGVAFNKGQR